MELWKLRHTGEFWNYVASTGRFLVMVTLVFGILLWFIPLDFFSILFFVGSGTLLMLVPVLEYFGFRDRARAKEGIVVAETDGPHDKIPRVALITSILFILVYVSGTLLIFLRQGFTPVGLLMFIGLSILAGWSTLLLKTFLSTSDSDPLR